MDDKPRSANSVRNYLDRNESIEGLQRFNYMEIATMEDSIMEVSTMGGFNNVENSIMEIATIEVAIEITTLLYIYLAKIMTETRSINESINKGRKEWRER